METAQTYLTGFHVAAQQDIEEMSVKNVMMDFLIEEERVVCLSMFTYIFV